MLKWLSTKTSLSLSLRSWLSLIMNLNHAVELPWISEHWHLREWLHWVDRRWWSQFISKTIIIFLLLLLLWLFFVYLLFESIKLHILFWLLFFWLFRFCFIFLFLNYCGSRCWSFLLFFLCNSLCCFLNDWFWLWLNWLLWLRFYWWCNNNLILSSLNHIQISTLILWWKLLHLLSHHCFCLEFLSHLNLCVFVLHLHHWKCLWILSWCQYISILINSLDCRDNRCVSLWLLIILWNFIHLLLHILIWSRCARFRVGTFLLVCSYFCFLFSLLFIILHFLF